MFGIAIGPGIAFAEAKSEWDDLSIKLGPLLFGLGPLLADEANSDNKRIVVGPIKQIMEVTALCGLLETDTKAFKPMPLNGVPCQCLLN